MSNVGFLFATGNTDVINSLNAAAVVNFCKSLGWEIQITRLNSNRVDRSSICFQAFNDKQRRDTLNKEKIYLSHGHFYGNLGTNNTSALKGQELDSFLQSNYGLNTASIQSVDGDGIVAVIGDSGTNVNVYPDPVGYRKVFYYSDNNILMTSTRLPFILYLYDKKWQLNTSVARMFLTKRSWAMWPETLVKEIKTLPPVHTLSYKDNSLIIKNIWKPIERNETYNDIQSLKDCLRKKTFISMQRMAEGKKTAISLSGGNDSTCLVKIARDFGLDFNAVSIGYDLSKESPFHCYNETPYASKIADELGVNFKSYLLTSEDVIFALEKLPLILDQPGFDPTTFFLFCRKLKEAGYSALIGGMGGDACFTPKSSYDDFFRTWRLFSPISKCPLLPAIMNVLATRLKMRGPLSYIRTLTEGKYPESGLELMDRYQETRRVGISHKLFGDLIVNDVDTIIKNRAKVFNKLIDKASYPHEWKFFFALWTDPAEYHMDLSCTLNNIDCGIPFVDNMFIQDLLRHSSKFDVASRQFEVDIAKGIPERKLIAKKNGLSLPYEVWGAKLMRSELDRAIDSGLINSLEIDRDYLLETCKPLFNQNEGFLSDPYIRHASSILWRLSNLSKYVDHYNLI